MVYGVVVLCGQGDVVVCLEVIGEVVDELVVDVGMDGVVVDGDYDVVFLIIFEGVVGDVEFCDILYVFFFYGDWLQLFVEVGFLVVNW